MIRSQRCPPAITCDVLRGPADAGVGSISVLGSTGGYAYDGSRWMCKPAWAEQMPSEGGIYRTRAEHVVQNHCSAADHTGLIAVGGRQNS